MFDMSQIAGGAGALVLGIGAWAGGAYVIGPTIGERLVTNTGEIGKCQATIQTATNRSVADAIASIPKPAPMPDVGANVRDTVATLFLTYPNGKAFMDMYGGRIQQYGDQFSGPAREKFEAARREYDTAVARLKRIGEVTVNASGDVCKCRAGAVINSPSGRSGLAWHVGSFGLVADAPVNDWQAAFSKPEIIAQCRGLS